MNELVESGKELKEQFRSPRRAFLISLGIVLLLIGFAGIFIPVLPGSLFTIPGLVLLSIYSPTMYKSLQRRVQKSPRIQSGVDRVRNWLINLVSSKK